MKIFSVCGSLGAASSNAAALRVATEAARAQGCVVDDATGLADIPAFRPEAVDDAPTSVLALRASFATADLLMIAAPEYAAGLCGSLKNALDWMVGSGSVYHRVVAVMSVGTTGGPFALEQLTRTLSWQGALVVATLGIDAPRTKMNERGVLDDPPTLVDIAAWIQRAIEARRGSTEDRRRAVQAVVSRYGIDIERFGEIP